MINTNFYRGFIELNADKTPKTRRMNRKLNNQWENVGGIFKAEYMMIDIDNYDDADLFMQLVDHFELKTHVVATDKGIHAIFRKPDVPIASVVNRETLSGIRCDIKQGRIDFAHSDYEAIRKNGKDREIIQECEDPQMLPFMLMPLSKELDLKDIGEGDSRHFVHQGLIARAVAYIHDAQQIHDWVCWVNDNIFKEPRESVNWSVRDIKRWIDEVVTTNIDDIDMNELLQQYDPNVKAKVLQFIQGNFDMKEV